MLARVSAETRWSGNPETKIVKIVKLSVVNKIEWVCNHNDSVPCPESSVSNQHMKCCR